MRVSEKIMLGLACSMLLNQVVFAETLRLSCVLETDRNLVMNVTIVSPTSTSKGSVLVGDQLVGRPLKNAHEYVKELKVTASNITYTTVYRDYGEVINGVKRPPTEITDYVTISRTNGKMQRHMTTYGDAAVVMYGKNQHQETLNYDCSTRKANKF